MIDLSLYTNPPTKETLQDYPTIMEVIEQIATEEENSMRTLMPLSLTNPIMPSWFYHLKSVGHFQLIYDNEIKMPLLMPTGKQGFVLYRGENNFHNECLPVLWREKKLPKRHKNTIVSYLQTAEMILAMWKHPIVKEITERPIHINNSKGGFDVHIPIQYDGLAQHYGIQTRYMDFTTNKWAAAFFAATKYINGKYVPYTIKEDDKIDNKYGIIYLLKIPTAACNSLISEYGILPIGQQYFNRPGCQSALVMDMEKYKDLNKCKFAQRIFFRHKNDINEMIYTLCQCGSQFFPHDSLQKVVDTITKRADLKFSKVVVELVRKIYYPKDDINSLCKMIIDLGIEIVDTDLIASFDSNDIKKDVELWEHGGRNRYLDKIHVMDLISLPNI